MKSIGTQPMPTEPPDEIRRSAWRGTLLRLLPVLALILGLAAFFVLDGPRHVGFDRLASVQHELKAWADSHPAMAPLAYMAVYAVVVALSLPIGSFATVLGGLLFGPGVGALWAAVGATTGACLVLLIARTAIGDSLRRRAGPAIRRMQDGFRANAFSYSLVLRLVPVFPFAVVNLVSACLHVPLSTFAAATFIGILPATFVFAGIGHGLGAVLAQGREPDLAVIARPEIFLPLLGLALLALLPVLVKALRRSS